MSGLKNSPFGKRLRAAQQDIEDDGHRRNRPKIHPIFGLSNASTPSLDSTLSTTSETTPESPRPRRNSMRERDKEYGDRFVPNRDSGDMRTSYHLKDEGGPSTPSKTRLIPTESDALKEQANSIFTSVLHSEVTTPVHRAPSPVRASTSSAPPTTPTRKRLLSYASPSRSNSTTPSRRLDNTGDDAYSMSPVRAESRQLLESPRRKLRSVCKTPYRVLDAPELADDFYLNLVDWSSTNVLGVGLGSAVYLWAAHTAAVSKLCDLSATNDTISSVAWAQKGSTLAVGTLSGRLHIYDATTLEPVRTYNQAHNQRVGAISWNRSVLSSGSRDRMIYHRDIRERDTRPFKKCAAHRQEVCGLRWSNDDGANSSLLASGGNDNKVFIWDLRGSARGRGSSPYGIGSGAFAQSRTGSTSSGVSAGVAAGDDLGEIPLHRFTQHTAAVKALAWDPHVPGILATGGGTQDKHIRFWNTNTPQGTLLSELDTGSQVCNLTWSLTSHELVSTHGFSSTTAQNQICIWKYPTLDMVASLSGHTHRVLYLAMSPDGETIVTGAGDETLRFWSAFPKKEQGDVRKESALDYGKLIR